MTVGQMESNFDQGYREGEAVSFLRAVSARKLTGHCRACSVKLEI
jgi:hypothetical protein